MKKVFVTRKEVVTNGPLLFETEEKAKIWIDSCLSKNKFGLPQRWKEESECSKEEIASSIAVQKREVEGVVKVFYCLPAEYEVKVEDYEVPVEIKVREDISKAISVHDFMIAYFEHAMGIDEKPMKVLVNKYSEIMSKYK